jgi:uncharacterized membrane protein
MPQPYTEPNQKEEITPEEYAAERNVGRSYAPDEYVTRGNAPEDYSSDPDQQQQTRVPEGSDRQRGYYNAGDQRWSQTTTGHAPQSSGVGTIERNRQQSDYSADDRRWSQTTTGHAPQSSGVGSMERKRGQGYYGQFQGGQYRGNDQGVYRQQRRSAPNVDQTERQIAVAAGGFLLLHAVLTRSRTSLLTGALGAALIWHGQSRHSPLYDALDVNTARQPLWDRGDGGQPGQAWEREQRREAPRQELRRGNSIEIERAVTINKPAEELYNYWRKLENLPNFMKHLQTVEQTDETHSHWVARLAGGLPVAWDAEIVEDQPNERIVWRTLPDAQVQQSGVVTFKPATGERGTVVNVDMRYSPPGGIVGETFARLLNGVTAQQVKDDIRRFKSLMETGEIPTIEGQSSGRA